MRRYWWLSVVIVVACISCDDEGTQLGSDFFREEQLSISYIDSATIKLSTVNLGDHATNSASRILLGTHKDEQLGSIHAGVYFQCSLPGAIDLRDINTQYEYAAIHLKHDGYSFYDTSALVTLTAWDLAEEIELSDRGEILNSDQFSTGVQLGSVSYYPKPTRKDSVEIKLNDSFAYNLYEKAKSADDVLQTSDGFTKHLKGFFVTSPTGLSHSILGFSKSSLELRLYYTDKSVTPSQLKHISFPISTSLYSNWIFADRGNTLLAALAGRDLADKLPAQETNGLAFMTGGEQLALRIDIPYLRRLKQLDNFYVTHAVLEVWPAEDSYNSWMPLPTTIIGYEVNHKNVQIGSTAYSTPLIEDKDLERDTYYALDVTSFVKSQMELQVLNENALLFTLPQESLNESVQRACFSSRGQNGKTKLRIYYATINE